MLKILCLLYAVSIGNQYINILYTVKLKQNISAHAAQPFIVHNFTSLFVYARDPAAVFDTTKLHMPCMGEFGGPASPWVVLGGYPGELNDIIYIIFMAFSENVLSNIM